MNDVRTIILKLIKEIMFGREPNETKSFSDMGLDSLDLVNAVMHIETIYGINIDEKESNLSKDMIISDFIKLVEQLVEAKEKPQEE